ncbi:lytic murein transglycosylase [Polaromonas sp.]|uniref:lytic murein transglycosylase n=1 Tax=Polaromonas sp. TaxID=1869339 RepID=UPI0017C43DDC|nr:lytic murein transglycosylase [Polaromonas sp.]NMM08340.1 lytic murein transglycosylase [Polaromonas sp.]
MQTTSRFSVSARCWLAPALLAIFVVAGCASAPSVETKAPAPSTVVASPTRVPDVSDDFDRSEKFARWVAEFSTIARAAGIDEATLQVAFDNVRLVPRVIESDRAQPEFTRTVWDYLDGALSTQRIDRGQDKLLQLRPDVDAIAARYGVPAEVLVAIWGMESNYGSNVGNIPTIDALATLGFDARREEWARGQLLAALKILQNRDIDRAQMIGSWAGAMGQTQFLPSNFLAYAVDADGDGRRDIWGSVADVMASTANFLARSGWQAGQPWGLEVRLPPGFDYARADADVQQPSTKWADEGVQAMDGAPLPALEGSSILLPASARGPAFLVGPNFRTILRYNNSTSYALAVGLLAQKLAGGPAMQTAWPRDLQALSRSQMLALQTALNVRGFDSGTPDGTIGPATRRGVRQYQRSVGLPADGYPTLDLLQRLQ